MKIFHNHIKRLSENIRNNPLLFWNLVKIDHEWLRQYHYKGEQDMSGEMRMPFGEHKGEQIMDIERSYLNWLLEQEWFEEKFSELHEHVKEHLVRRDRSYDTF